MSRFLPWVLAASQTIWLSGPVYIHAQDSRDREEYPLERTRSALPADATARLGRPHIRGISLVALSPEQRLAVWNRDGTFTLRDISRGQDIDNPPDHWQSGLPDTHLFALAFLPGGKALTVLADTSGKVYLREFGFSNNPSTINGRDSRQAKNKASNLEKDSFRCFALSTDGKTLAGGLSGSSGRKPAIRLWEAIAGKELYQLNVIQEIANQEQEVGWLAFSANGNRLASASEDGTFCLRDARTGKEVSRFKGSPLSPRAGYQVIALAPDGRLVAQVSDRTIDVWDGGPGKKVHTLRGHQGEVRAITFSSDSSKLISASRDRSIQIWNLATGKSVQTLEGRYLKGEIETVAVSPDGKLLVAGTEDDFVVFAAATDRHLGGGFSRLGQPELFLSSEGNAVAIGRMDGLIRIVEVASGKVLNQLSAHAGFNDLTLSADRRLLAEISEPQTIHVWETDTGRILQRLQCPKYVTCVAISPDGKTLASGNWFGILRTWDAATGRKLREVNCPEGRITSIVYSPDSRLMATVHREKFPGICLRDANTGEKLFDLRHDYGQVNKVAFSKDGKILASGGWAVAGPTELGPPDLSDALHIWDIGAKRSLRRFPGNPTTIDRDRKQRLISDIAISPDGRTLATVEGLAIVLREVATGGMRKTLKGHQEEITGAVFDPKGRSLISVSWDNTALVWDLTGHIRNGSFQPSSLSPQQAEALWADLAGADTAKAYQSIWTLMTAPDATVALMQKRLRPIPAVNSQHIDDLIAALDDHHYAARRNASQELERLGELAEPALRRILASGPSAEVRRRIEDLLRIERELPPPQLRVLRSIEVLEQIGSSGAQVVLKEFFRCPGIPGHAGIESRFGATA